ncbi:hypothetical protein Tco_1333142 [Tanacetum coccineum]
MHLTTLIPYPRFTKIIVDHILTEHPDISKRTNEPYHRVENDEVVKSIFDSRNRKGRGMRIPEWLLMEEMKQTKNYKVCAADFQIAVLMTHLDEATRVRITTTRSIEEYEAQYAIKKVDEHLMDKDIEKLVEGEEINADKFANDMLMISQIKYLNEKLRKT